MSLSICAVLLMFLGGTNANPKLIFTVLDHGRGPAIDPLPCLNYSTCAEQPKPLSGTSEQVLAFSYAKSISAVESAAPSHASIEATDRFGYAWRTYKEVELVHHLSIYPTAVLWLLLRIGLGRIAYFRLLRQLTFRYLRCRAMQLRITG